MARVVCDVKRHRAPTEVTITCMGPGKAMSSEYLTLV